MFVTFWFHFLFETEQLIQLSFMLMPFPTSTPVMPRRTDGLNVIVDVLKETIAPQRPVQHPPKKN